MIADSLTLACFSSDLSTVDPQSPAKHLISLISTTLLPSAPGLNLSLTLLLHGPKGVGKRHLIKQCCEATSVNYVEVNCFDLSGDAEAKTEQNLRDKWKHWEDSCPAVVVLRNLEALSKMDKGEEVAGKRGLFSWLRSNYLKSLIIWSSTSRTAPRDRLYGALQKAPDNSIRAQSLSSYRGWHYC